jgi:hypothetical protein
MQGLAFKLILALASIWAVSANAADLGYHQGGLCQSYGQSTLASLDSSTINQTVVANFESARGAMSDPRVLANRRSAYVWAMEARWACEAAAGYLKNGTLDEESIQKCDCFYRRFISFR